MAKLYDRADIYDLLENEERYQFLKKHWEAVLAGCRIHTLLDVSIGSGSVTLPLLDLGVTVSGSDLSEAMLERCRKKAAAKGASLDLRVCDFRKLTECFHEQFDCVASTGNSLAYVSNDEVMGVLEQMDRLVAPGGYLYLDLRNWDYVVQTKQRFYFYNPVFQGDTRINLFQVWDHNADNTVDFNLIYSFEQNNRILQKEIFQEHNHPIPQKMILDKLNAMGYDAPMLARFPAQAGEFKPDSDWYCLMARKKK